MSNIESGRRLRRALVFGPLFVILLALPFIIQSGYIIHVFIISAIWVMMATGYNLLLGYTGLFSFGHAGFIAVGAYSSAILVMNLHVPWPVGVLFAGLITAIFALLTGGPFLRLGGVYFAFITMGFAEIVRTLIVILETWTGGQFGITNVPSLFDSLSYTYVFVFLAMSLVFVIVYRIVHSRIGRALVAIRENPVLAASNGINVARYSLLAYTVSAVICGVGGAIIVHYLGIAYPEIATVLISVDLVIFTKLGGRGTLVGPAIAASIFTFFPEMFRFVDEWRPVIYAITLIVVLLLAPMGLEPVIRKALSRIANRIRSRKSLPREGYDGAP